MTPLEKGKKQIIQRKPLPCIVREGNFFFFANISFNARHLAHSTELDFLNIWKKCNISPGDMIAQRIF